MKNIARYRSIDKLKHYTRFILVGAINTGFSYLTYAGFLFIGLGYALANLLALLISVLLSFKMQGRFVFKNTDSHLIWRFVLSWAVIYLCVITLIGWII